MAIVSKGLKCLATQKGNNLRGKLSYQKVLIAMQEVLIFLQYSFALKKERCTLACDGFSMDKFSKNKTLKNVPMLKRRLIWL